MSYVLLLFQYFGVACFIYGWTSNSIIGKILGTLSIFILFIAEARAYAIIGVIGLTIIRFYNHKIFSKTTLKITFLSFFIFFAAFVPRYGSKIIDAKNNNNLLPYLAVLFGSYEFGQISYNLNAAVDSNYNSSHNIPSLFASTVPLINRLYRDREMGRFHEHIEKDLNPGFGYGLGGTFWGETYILGGFLGIIFNLILIFLSIHWLKKRIFSGNIFYPIYLSTLIFITFYLPRNDIYIIIAVMKNLLLFIMLYFISFILITKKSTIKV